MTSGERARSAGAAWALLDWAASAFSTVLITLVVAYVERVVFADRAWGVDPGVVWAWTLAVAMLLSALITPFLAAWADRHEAHVSALVGGVLLGAGGLVVLGILPPTARLGVAAAVVLAAVGFDVAVVFTGSLLPRIASGAAADRLSAAGFALGYAGGAIALVVATAIVAAHDKLGLSMVGGLRAAFVFTAVWWLLFSWPAAVVRFGPAPPAAGEGSSFGDLRGFVADLGRGDAASRALLGVLGGAMLTLGAVQTAIAQFSSVALEEFRLTSSELVKLVLLVQFVALPGALAVGWLSTRWGRTAAFITCLAGWGAVLALAWRVQTTGQLHAVAVLLALVLGGVQSVVRAIVAGAAPAGRSGATFGLLHVGTKLAGFAANLLFGAVLAASGQPRAGLLVLLGFLVAGGWLAVRPPHHASPRTSRIE
ncbi:MAG: hypothetical protein RLZZ111_1696 [Planctomycetota bacterium]|jgi:UMF1 family MFS transporter